MNEETIFWYDLETFGLDTARDRIAQVAGLRTDLDLNIVGQEINLMCKIAPDYLPTPQSCLVTGQTPEQTIKEGLVEAEFIKKIHEEFMVPGTTVAGFNNISYDDEMLRHTFYRNLYDPYEREYGSSRYKWDVLDLARVVHDLRPEGINFLHKNEKGRTQVKLTYLTEDNNIEQVGAHDALVDIYATINFAKLVKEKQPKLFNYFFSHRSKQALQEELMKLSTRKVMLYTSGKFTSEYGFTHPIYILTTVHEKTTKVFYFDLTKDANELLKDFKTIKEVEGLGSLQLNKCPYLTTSALLEKDQKVQERLHIDMDLYKKNIEIILANPQIEDYLLSLNNEYPKDENLDIDFNLYSNGFITWDEKNEYNRIRKTEVSSMIALASKSCKEKVFRYVARSYPEALTAEEKAKWRDFVKSRINLTEYYLNIENSYKELQEANNLTEANKEILNSLTEYGKKIEREWLLDEN